MPLNALPHPADPAAPTHPTAPEATPDTAPKPSDSAPYMRVIKSYVLRAGRTGPGQVRAYEQHGPKYLLKYQPEPLDVDVVFGRQAPLILEIGFGMGGATAQIAQVRPQDNFLACEVHEPGVGALLKLIGEGGIENIRILRHDAVEVMDHMLGEQSLDGVQIQGPFVNRLARHLKPGGYLHLATDWEPYAEQMFGVLKAEPLLANTAAEPGPHGSAPKPAYRPLTKFENRGLKLGHGVWDLVFRRV